jgi:hypothetical protein
MGSEGLDLGPIKTLLKEAEENPHECEWIDGVRHSDIECAAEELLEEVERQQKIIKDLEAMLQELIDAGHRSIQTQMEIDLTPLAKARAVLAGQEWKPTPKVMRNA